MKYLIRALIFLPLSLFCMHETTKIAFTRTKIRQLRQRLEQARTALTKAELLDDAKKIASSKIQYEVIASYVAELFAVLKKINPEDVYQKVSALEPDLKSIIFILHNSYSPAINTEQMLFELSCKKLTVTDKVAWARKYDQVCISNRAPQRYGTVFKANGDIQTPVAGFGNYLSEKNLKNINLRRIRIGLNSIEEQITDFHQNKQKTSLPSIIQ